MRAGCCDFAKPLDPQALDSLLEFCCQSANRHGRLCPEESLPVPDQQSPAIHINAGRRIATSAPVLIGRRLRAELISSDPSQGGGLGPFMRVNSPR
jgi:hypothetical protein